MHIVICHDAVIPPPTYGGTERILHWLIEALNRMGHRTTLVAPAECAIPGTTVIPLPPGARPEPLVPTDADVVHLMSPPKLPLEAPYLVSIHGNGVPGEVFPPNTTFVSRKHAENHGTTHFVYNGLPPGEYQCEPERGDHLVFLAKASWNVKNLKGAIRVARAAKLPLEVLGSRDLPFNLQKVLPPVRGVRYHGQIDEAEKRRILSTARGLLFPVRWHEPFGLAVIEALASGTPVYATPYGALPEIVTPEVGVLSADGRDLVRALRDGPAFSPTACRRRVEDAFTADHMAREYLRYYERVAKTGSVEEGGRPATPPRTKEGFVYHELLPWTSP